MFQGETGIEAVVEGEEVGLAAAVGAGAGAEPPLAETGETGATPETTDQASPHRRLLPRSRPARRRLPRRRLSRRYRRTLKRLR